MDTSEMPVEGAEGGSHQNENKKETRVSSISAEETVFDITDDGKIDASNGDQEKEEQISVSIDAQNNGAGLASEEGANEMLTEDNGREGTETVASDEKKEIIDDDTNTTKEVFSVPKKKVLRPKKVVKKVVKRKVVKGKVLGKNEEEPQSSDMPQFVEVPTNQDVKNEENLDDVKSKDHVNSSLTETVSLNEKEENKSDDTSTAKEASLVPNKGLTPKKVVKRKVVKGKVLGKNEEEPQSSNMHEFVEVPTNQGVKNEENLDDVKSKGHVNSSLTETVSLNEKEENKNDDTNTAKEASLVPNKGLMPKKVVKKRKLVKGKVAAKDEEEPQSSETPKPVIEVLTNENEERTNENAENEDSPNTKLIDEGKSSAEAVTLNEKEEVINDDTNITQEVLMVPNNVLKPKRVVKKVIKKVVKRKLVKGKVVAKEESQSSKMPDPSIDGKKEENVDIKPIDEGNSSSMVKTKNKQSENNKQAGKEKAASKSENLENMKKEAKSKLRKVSSTKAGKNDEAVPSEKGKSSNEAETMGMIFMCSSKTKEDCYRYKIFGLPASKKDVVLKVHKGMKLFLFDFQLKLLYGIYQAAGPGGYNIERKAFNSNFPSQVRFTIVQNHNPLPEAKFKQVIKDNYYTYNKFSCELNSKQVKGLCELFSADIKGKAVTDRPKAEIKIRPIVDKDKKRKATAETELNQGREKRKAVAVDSERDTKRRRVIDNVKHSKAKVGVRPSRVNGDVRRPRVEDASRRLILEDNARRARAKDDARLWFEDEARRLRLENEARRRSPQILNRYTRLADLYDREAYLPSAIPAPLHIDPLPQPVPSYTSSYGYGRTSVLDEYRPEVTIGQDNQGLSYSGSRLLYEYETRNRNLPYRDPIEHRDPEYTVGTSRVYSPLATRDEYLPSTSNISAYRRY